MAADSNDHNETDDLTGYEYFHPVHVLGFWLADLIEIVRKPRFLDAEPGDESLTEKELETKYGPIDTTAELHSWAEKRANALIACDKALEAAVGVNRWLRYGLGERAGRLETELRSLLPEPAMILKSATDVERFTLVRKAFEEQLEALYRFDDELSKAALNHDDGALEEWFNVIEAMRSALSEFLSCHGLLHQIVFSVPRRRIGDTMYRYVVAGCEFESLLPVVRSQIRRGYRGDEEYGQANQIPRMCAQARWSFEEVLTNNKLPPDAYPVDIHQRLRNAVSRTLRRLELTFSERPKADQPRVLWSLGIAHSPAHRPSWDKERRVLRFGDVVCKRFKAAAPNQETVLQAFQEENWPPRIDDPLRPGKLHETVRQLNRANKVIRFTSDGHGEGVCWALAHPPK